MMGSAVIGCLRKKKRAVKNRVYDNDEKNRHNHGPRGGPAHLFGTSAGCQPFQASDGGNVDAEHDAFHKARRNVAEEQGIDRSPGDSAAM